MTVILELQVLLAEQSEALQNLEIPGIYVFIKLPTIKKVDRNVQEYMDPGY